MSKVRILVVDDVAFWREFVCSVVRSEPLFEIICEAVDGNQAFVIAGRLQPTIALLDVGLPKVSGIDAAIAIRRLAPDTRIVFLSDQRDPDVVRAALQVADGYVLKSDAGRDLVPAIHSVAKGDPFISRQVGDLLRGDNFSTTEPLTCLGFDTVTSRSTPLLN
jgi:DNA-binding NarL/FixJ family response regulator